MPTTTLQFSTFEVSKGEYISPIKVLPLGVVTVLDIQLLDPVGDWVNPKNAGGAFRYGAEYTVDGGDIWSVLVSNGTGQRIGSLNPDKSLPNVRATNMGGFDGVDGMPCRFFARSSVPLIFTARLVVETS